MDRRRVAQGKGPSSGPGHVDGFGLRRATNRPVAARGRGATDLRADRLFDAVFRAGAPAESSSTASGAQAHSAFEVHGR